MSKRTKGWLIAAISLILIGCILFVGVMTMLNWNFGKLSTDKYETNTHAVTEAFTNLSIIVDTADVVFAPSTDDTVSVVCYEETKAKHAVSVEGDTLVIKVAEEVKWHQRLGFHLDTAKITVYLPAGVYGTLKIKATTGDVTIPKGFSFASVDISVTTGDITCFAVVSGNMMLKITTGDTTLTDVTCRNLTFTGTTGDIVLNDVIASEAFVIKCSTGDVTFKACDAAALQVKTTTGDITGTLLTAKVFDANTTTGRVSVPQSTTGGKCKLNATTGSIKITIL